MECPDLSAGGPCLLSDPGCLDLACADPTLTCIGCIDATASCFFDTTLWQEDCSGIASFWSNSPCIDCGGESYWYMDFATPYPLFATTQELGVRCVRTL